jgi:bilin biosynthesis protein
MEENEKKVETGENAKQPVITRSMCETCSAEEEPEIPENLPEESWSTEKLIEATKDQNLLVRSNAVTILSKRGPDVAVEPLIEALKDKEYIVKTNAMVALSTYGKQMLDRMIAALNDPDPDVRAGAAWILGELKDPKAIEPLEKAAKDEYPLARIQAKASLMAMGIGQKKAEKEEKKD